MVRWRAIGSKRLMERKETWTSLWAHRPKGKGAKLVGWRIPDWQLGVSAEKERQEGGGESNTFHGQTSVCLLFCQYNKTIIKKSKVKQWKNSRELCTSLRIARPNKMCKKIGKWNDGFFINYFICCGLGDLYTISFRHIAFVFIIWMCLVSWVTGV